MTVRRALTWLLAAALVPLVVGSGFFYLQQWHDVRADVDNELAVQAETLMQTVDRELAANVARIETIAASDLVERGDWTALRRLGAEMLQSEPLTLLVVVGPDGQVLMNTSVPPGAPLPNLWKLDAERRTVDWQGRQLPLSSQGLTRDVFATGRVQYSNLYFGVNTRRPTLAAAVPVRRGGKTVMVVTMSMSPSSLQRVIEAAPGRAGVRVAVIDRAGRVLANNRTSAAQVGDTVPPLPGPPTTARGAYAATARDAVPVIVGFARSELTGYTVRVALPRSVAYAEAGSTALRLSLVMLAAMTVAAVYAGWLGRRLALPLIRLARRVESGPAPGSAEPPSGIVEIDALHHALERAAESETRRREEAVSREVAEEAAAQVARSEDRLRRVIDNLAAFVGILDLDGTLLEANRTPIEQAGLRRDEVVGRKFWDCHWWSYDPALQQTLRDAVQRAGAGETVRFDVRVRMAGDTRITIDFQIAPLRDDAGRIVLLVPSATDISERVEANLAAREAARMAREAAAAADAERRLLDATFDATPAGVIVCDAAGKILRMNRANERVWGVAPYSESVGRWGPWRGWWADGSARHGLPLAPEDWGLARALKGETVPGDIVAIEPFGQPGVRRVVLLSAAPVRDAAGAIVGGVVAQVDITDRIHAEEALRDSEARFRALADNIPQLAWIGDGEGHLYWYNQRWCDYTGLSVQQSSGEGWRQVHHPEHLERVAARFADHVRRGVPWEDTFPMRRHDGEFFWFLSRAVPIRDDGGRVVRWFGTNTDITEQLHTEQALRDSEERLRAREQALRDADRQKDEFLATLAHELRNPLAPIRTAAESIRRRNPADPAIARARETIERQVLHLARLVDDLLDVSRISFGDVVLQRRPTPLAAIVTHAVEAARPALTAGGQRFELAISEEPLVVDVDATRIAQALSNLLHNAAKFTPAGGVVRLEVGRVDDAASLLVSDTGVGVAPENLERIFDLFMQERRSGLGGNTGLGIGLALTRKLVRLHGGEVRAKSGGSGQGSEFEIRLPLHHGAAPATPGERDAPRAAGSRRVLVVDDNVDAAESLAEILQSEGHAVSVAHDGAGALRAEEAQRPEVIVLDIGLPDCSGYEVAQRVVERRGEATPLLIALTGWGQPGDRDRARAAGFAHHLTKPCDPEELCAMLREHSAEASAS